MKYVDPGQHRSPDRLTPKFQQDPQASRSLTRY